VANRCSPWGKERTKVGVELFPLNVSTNKGTKKGGNCGSAPSPWYHKRRKGGKKTIKSLQNLLKMAGIKKLKWHAFRTTLRVSQKPAWQGVKGGKKTVVGSGRRQKCQIMGKKSPHLKLGWRKELGPKRNLWRRNESEKQGGGVVPVETALPRERDQADLTGYSSA